MHYSKAVYRTFSGTNSKQLDHYIIPITIDDKQDLLLLHVGTNDRHINPNHIKVANNIIKIGISCKKYGANEVFTLSVLVKKNPT